MAITSTGQMAGPPIVDLQVAFTGTQTIGVSGPTITVGANPNDPTITPTWTSLSHRLVSFNIRFGKRYELDQATAEEGEARLRNTDGALDPTNTSGPYSPYVLPFRQARIVITPPGLSPVTIWTGYIEAWTQSWSLHGTYGWVTVRLVDALTALSQIILNSCLSSEILLDGPVGYWMLSEPSTAASSGNSAATTSSSMQQVQLGTGGTCRFGAVTLTTLVGAGATDGLSGPVTGNTTGVNLTPASSLNGIYLQAGISNSSPLHMLLHFSTTTASQTLMTAGATLSGSATLYIDATGKLGLRVGNNTYAISSSTVTDGTLHTVELVLKNSGGAGTTVYLDGAAQTPTAISTPYTDGTWTTVTIGYDTFVGSASWNNLFSGTVAHAAVFSSAPTATRISTHRTAGTTAFAGEDSGARFNRILNYAPWNGPRNVPAGANTLQGATNLAGKSALAALLAVVDAEQSNMYISRAGEVTFENRQARYKQLTTVWTFGENTGELPYEEGAQVASDPSQVFNVVQVIRPAGVIVNDSDAASALSYFVRSYPQTPLVLPVTDDNTAIAAAQYLIGKYKQPQARLAEAQFRPSRNPNLWTFATTAKIGDRSHFNRRTSQGAPAVSLDVFIEALEYRWDAQTGDLMFGVEASPAFWQNYGILTAARGTLASTVAAGATSVQVTVATDPAGNTPAQNGWTASAMPSIQFVDGSNSETVAVSAMSVSGQTVTITCAATTKAHTSGIVVAETSGSATYNQYDVAATLDGNHSVGY